MSGHSVSLAIVCLALLLLVAPTVSAGPGTAKPPKGGNLDGGDAGGGPEGDNGTVEPPPEMYPTVPVLVPPHANLVIALLRPERDEVQIGTPLRFYVIVENSGYRHAANATVALVDGEPGVVLGTANVTLEDFRGSAGFTWIASGPGDHTIVAVADPFGYLDETNETDNQRSTPVRVSINPPVGKADVSVAPVNLTPATDLVANLSAAVNVTVHNAGDAGATSVVVEVWEVERNLKVANYSIVSLSAGASNTRSVSWTPDGEGPRHLEVRVDPYNAIPEHNESDNVAREGFHVRRPGTLEECTSEGDCPDLPLGQCDGVVGDTYVVYGDLTIPSWKTVQFIGCYVRVYGNVFVDGTLILQFSVLVLMASSPNQYRVEVRAGGHLSFGDSFLLPARSSYGISAVAMAASDFEFLDSHTFWLYGLPLPFAPGGLQIYTADARIEGSSVDMGSGHGIYLAPGVSVPSIVGNSIGGNRGAGIAFGSGAWAPVSSNSLTWNRFGVVARQASPALTGNTVSNNTYGLYFDGTSSASVTANVIDRNAWGIFLFGAFENTVPVLDGVTVGNSSRAGVYALASNLTLLRSTVWRSYSVLGQGGIGVVVDLGPSLPWSEPRTMPTIVDNDVGSYLDYYGAVWKVIRANVSDNRFFVANNGLWITDSQATVRNNSWRDALGPCTSPKFCVQLALWRCPSADLSRNQFDPGGAAGILGLRSIASSVFSANDSFLRTGNEIYEGVYADQGSHLDLDNATLDRVSYPVSASGSTVDIAFSRMWRLEDNPSGLGIYVNDSAGESSIVNSTVEHYHHQVTIANTTARIEGNAFRYRYYPPGFNWTRTEPDTPDRCHVCVYRGAVVDAQNNTLFGGAFGFIVESGGVGRPSRLDAADNLFDHPGLHAVATGEEGLLYDVNELTATGNLILNASAAALGATTAGNATFRNNTVAGCHGYAGGYIGYWFGCVWVRNGNRPPVGRVEFRGNMVSDANLSAMRAETSRRVVHFYNNTVDCVLCYDPRPAQNESGIDIWGLPVAHSVIPRVENNTVRRAYIGLRLGIPIDSVPVPGVANASHNRFVDNRRYGIAVLNTSSDPKASVWWNDLTGNEVEGLHVELSLPGPGYWHAECNWWGHDLGPHDPLPGNPDTNPNPNGEPVSDYFHYRDEQPPPTGPQKWWLRLPAGQATICAPP